MKTRYYKSVLIGLFLMFFSQSGFADNLSSQNAKGNKLYDSKKYEEALKVYRDAQIEEPESPELHYNIGTTLFRKKGYEEAIKELEKTLTAKDPQLQQKAYYNMGDCQYRLGEEMVAQGKQEGGQHWQQAIEAYKKSLELNSNDMDAKCNIEFVQNKLKELAQNSPQNKQQQQQQNQQNKQDQKKDQQQKQDQQKQAGEKKDEQQKEGQQGEQDKQQMSKEDAQRLLDAVKDEEKDLQKKLRKVQVGVPRGISKDW
jgi:Ca-activated chloride channel homolog